MQTYKPATLSECSLNTLNGHTTFPSCWSEKRNFLRKSITKFPRKKFKSASCHRYFINPVIFREVPTTYNCSYFCHSMSWLRFALKTLLWIMQILWNAKPAQVILNLEWLIIDKFAINNNKNSKNDIIWINNKNELIRRMMK